MTVYGSHTVAYNQHRRTDAKGLATGQGRIKPSGAHAKFIAGPFISFSIYQFLGKFLTAKKFPIFSQNVLKTFFSHLP